MSRLEELIAELCPDGVEYIRLGDATEMKRGTSLTKKNAKVGVFPVISGGREPAFYCDTFNREDETITVAGSGAGAGYVQYWNNPIFVCDAFSIKANSESITKYIYYCLVNMQGKIFTTKTGGGIPHVHISSIENFTIPIPPLPVQREIVRILDNFTELTARKKQYEYYCKQVFKNSKGSQMVKIRDLGDWSGGGTPSMQHREYWDNGTIPWISSKDMKAANLLDTQDHITEKAVENSSSKLLPKNTVAVVVRSGILKRTLPVAFVPFKATVNQDLKALVVKQGILPRYSYFVIFAYAEDILRKTKKAGGTVDSLDVQAFFDFQVPLATAEEQARIVAILDRFDDLCNDITSGLPAEIAARQKQYEYYRDKLLTFKELS